MTGTFEPTFSSTKRKLKATWSLEAAQDWSVSIGAISIQNEIDKEILKNLLSMPIQLELFDANWSDSN